MPLDTTTTTGKLSSANNTTNCKPTSMTTTTSGSSSGVSGGVAGIKKSLRLTSLAEDIIPPEDAPFRARLHALFSQIEKEFEILYIENLNCKFPIEILSQTISLSFPSILQYKKN